MAYSTVAGLTLVQTRSLMASLMQDEGNSFWTAAQKTQAINYWYGRWYEQFNNRLAQYTGTSTGYAFTNGLKFKSSADATILSHRHAYIEAAAGDFELGAEIEIITPARLKALQVATPAVGTPAYASFERLAAISNSNTPGVWQARLFPIPSGNFWVSAHVKTTPYSAGADSDMLDCSENEAKIVAALAAIEGATIGGRDSEFVQARWVYVPREVQAVMRSEMTNRVLQSQYDAGASPT